MRISCKPTHGTHPIAHRPHLLITGSRYVTAAATVQKGQQRSCEIRRSRWSAELFYEEGKAKAKEEIETVDAIKEAEKVSIDTGLDQFQLIPGDAAGMPKLSGLELFEHDC